MKICHVSSCHNATDVRIYHKEVLSLTKHGYKCSIIVPGENDFTFNDVSIICVPHPPKVFGKVTLGIIFVTQFYIMLACMRNKCKVYHLHDQYILPIGLFLKALGKVVIYDVHEDYPRQFQNRTKQSFLNRTWIRMFEIFENLCAQAFNGIVTVTDPIFNRFSKKNKNTILVKNYPILEHFHDESENGSERKDLVYVGFISEIRGIKQMIQAVGLTKYRLKLIGKFGSSKLYDECRSMPGWSNVDYLGFLERDDVVKELKKSKVGLVLLHPVQTYLDDALPVKLFEYLAAGLPVICSNFPLYISLIEKSQCGICLDPFDINKITNSINWLMENHDEYIKYSKTAEKHSLNFSWYQEERKLLKFYNQY